MADLVITATSIVKGSDAKTREVTAGATITAGQAVYLDATDSNKAKLADNDASETTATAVGIALNGASASQPLLVQYGGNLTMGAILTKGVVYVVSGTAGAICPIADLATDDYATILGIASSTSVLDMDIFSVTGVKLP